MTEAFTSPRIEGEFSGEQMRAWDVVWGAVRGKAADSEQLCGCHRREHHVGHVGDHDDRALLAGVPAEGRRRGDQRADRDHRPAGRRSAPCVRHRRLRHRRAADRRVRRLPGKYLDADGLRPDGDRQRRLLRRAGRERDQRGAVSRARARGCRTFRSSKAAAAEPATPTSAGTAPTPSTSTRAASRPNRSPLSKTHRPADFGAAQLHRRGQRLVRRAALRGQGRAERRVRRRRRHRQDRRRHQRQQRADDGAARGRVAPPLGLGRRPDRDDARAGRRRHVHRARHVARSVRASVPAAALAVHDRGGRADRCEWSAS